jgi:hypothetical protein
MQWIQVSFPDVKRTGREADQSLPVVPLQGCVDRQIHYQYAFMNLLSIN